MTKIQVRAKTEIKLSTPQTNLTVTYVKGTSLSVVVRYLLGLMLIDTPKEDVQAMLDEAILANEPPKEIRTPEQALVDFYQAYTAWREPEIKAVEWLAMGAEVKRTYHALAGWELDSFSGYEDLLRILVRCWSAYIHSMPADSDRLKILSDLDSAVRAIGLTMVVRGLTAPSISNTMTDPSS